VTAKARQLYHRWCKLQ